MTNPAPDGRSTAAARYCRMSKVSLSGMTILMRYEVDAIDPVTRETIEFKCKKLTKQKYARYGLNEDFFLNIWIQMMISNTAKVLIGLHEEGFLYQILDLSLAQIQAKAGLSSAQVTACLQKLASVLQRIVSGVQEGEQRIVRLFAASHRQPELLPNSDFNFRMFSTEMRAKLQQIKLQTKNKVKQEVKQANKVVAAVAAKADVEDVDTIFARLTLKAKGKN